MQPSRMLPKYHQLWINDLNVFAWKFLFKWTTELSGENGSKKYVTVNEKIEFSDDILKLFSSIEELVIKSLSKLNLIFLKLS